MEHVWLVRSLVLFLIMICGCASGGDMELRLRQLREETYAEIRNQASYLRDGFKKDLKDVENGIKKDMKDVQKDLQSQIVEMRETQKKDKIETDKTLIDHQKQIFSSKTIIEDNTRRVYYLESIITSRTPSAAQVKDGFITFINENEVSISLGSVNGVRAGDYFEVNKDQEKIATIRIDTVEPNSSKGVVVNKEKQISIGDKVEIEKKQ